MSETTAAPAPEKASKLPVLLSALNSLLLAGVLAMLVLRPGGASATTAHGKGEPAAAKPEAHGAEAPAAEHKEGHEPAAKAEGGHGGGHEGGEAASGAAPGPTMKLPDFVIHLRNPEADRYARLSFELELASEHDKTDLTARMPQLRDSFIAYLSDRTLEELRGSEALEQTKAALLRRLGTAAPSAHVRALYITDMVVQ